MTERKRRGILAAPNSFRRGPSTRRARKLRRMVTRTIEARKALEAIRLERAKRQAERNVQNLTELLRPERILRLQQSLAYWQAARDSLEDDGVMPDRKSYSA